MNYHIAFVQAEPLARIMRGVKTVECRLSKGLHPARSVAPGDWLIFKASGGPVVAAAPVLSVDRFDDLRPCDVRALAELVSPLTGGAPDSPYWHMKTDARYAVLIHFGTVLRASVPAALTPRSVFSGWVANFPVGYVSMASQ